MENQTINSNENLEEPIPDSIDEEEEINISDEQLDAYVEKLRLEQNLPLGLIGGIIAAILSAILWAVVTVATEFQIGYMAVAVGFIVGYTIRYLGKGFDKTFGIIGAILSIIGCLLGNFLSIVGFIAEAEGLGYFETLTLIDYRFLPDIMIETFSFLDLLFYGIAIYAGYRFSFRQISYQEIIADANEF